MLNAGDKLKEYLGSFFNHKFIKMNLVGKLSSPDINRWIYIEIKMMATTIALLRIF